MITNPMQWVLKKMGQVCLVEGMKDNLERLQGRHFKSWNQRMKVEFSRWIRKEKKNCRYEDQDDVRECSSFYLLGFSIAGHPAMWGNLSQYDWAVGIAGGAATGNLPAMQEPQEMQVRALGQEDALEEGMATHSRNLAWRIPWTEEPGGQRVEQDWSDLACTHTWLGSG